MTYFIKIKIIIKSRRKNKRNDQKAQQIMFRTAQ